MWESEFSNITLIDVINTSDISVRTSNCLLATMDDNYFSIKTVEDYMRAGDKVMEIFLRMPNMGRKSFEELDNTIKDVIDAGGITKAYMENAKYSPEILDDIGLLSIGEFVDSNLTSVRLRNSIKSAVNNGELPFETVGDYVKAGNKALHIIKKLPNIGFKTAIEFDGLIKVLFSNKSLCDKGVCHGTVTRPVELDDAKIEIPNVAGTLLEKFSKNLKEREYDVLKYRAVENKTLEEIGRKYNVTRERIRQIEKKVISKLLRVYKGAFNRVASNIDKILDESYGEVRLLDAANTLDLAPDTLKLLTYICAEQCNKHVRVKNGYLLRPSVESNHSEWNEAIDEVLYSFKWPICSREIYDEMQDIPQSYVERYLVKNRGAMIEDGTIVALKKIPQTARMVYVLRNADGCLHSTDIAKKYNEMFGGEIKEHNAQSIVGRMEEALIVDRGVYALYESLNVSENKIAEIRDHSYQYIRDEEKYVSSKVLYRDLFKNNVNFPEIDNAYIIHGVLQDDRRFVIRRGFMIGIVDHVGFVKFKPLTDEVHELVSSKGPITVSQIKAAISDRRNVLSVGISKILEQSNKVIKIMPGVYDSIENTFRNEHSLEELKLAIRITLSDHDQGLFELTTNLRSLLIFGALEVTKSMIVSILDMMNDVSKKSQNYSIASNNKEVESYNAIIKTLHQGESKFDVTKKVRALVGVKLAREYIAADYRMQPDWHEGSRDKKKMPGGSREIDSILSAFEI